MIFFSIHFLKVFSPQISLRVFLKDFLILRILSLMSLIVMKTALFLQNIVYLFNWREVFPLKNSQDYFSNIFQNVFFFKALSEFICHEKTKYS